jgi:flagellin-specific chaperone FliS
MDTLDLDKLEPKPQTLSLRGKEFVVYPAKIRSIIEIEKYFAELSKMKGQEAIDRAFDILNPLIPALKEDKSLDFTAEQLFALLNYVYRAGAPEKKEKDSKKK